MDVQPNFISKQKNSQFKYSVIILHADKTPFAKLNCEKVGKVLVAPFGLCHYVQY